VSDRADARGETAVKGVVIVHACHKRGKAAGTLQFGPKKGGVDGWEKEAQAQIIAELRSSETNGRVSGDAWLEPEGGACA
jgi:hypothetical protein